MNFTAPWFQIGKCRIPNITAVRTRVCDICGTIMFWTCNNSVNSCFWREIIQEWHLYRNYEASVTLFWTIYIFCENVGWVKVLHTVVWRREKWAFTCVRLSQVRKRSFQLSLKYFKTSARFWWLLEGARQLYYKITKMISTSIYI